MSIYQKSLSFPYNCSRDFAETPRPNSYLFFPGHREYRHHDRIRPVTNDCPLYAEGLYLELLPFLWLMIVQSDLIAECTSLAQGENVVFRWGIWNADPSNNLTPQEAANCSSF
jgi:hypothetical protein